MSNTPALASDSISLFAEGVSTRVVYNRVLNSSVKAYIYVEGKTGRVQIVDDGSVNVTGRFTNAEMAAMIEAALSFNN
jgi:acylphosphatase